MPSLGIGPGPGSLLDLSLVYTELFRGSFCPLFRWDTTLLRISFLRLRQCFLIWGLKTIMEKKSLWLHFWMTFSRLWVACFLKHNSNFMSWPIGPTKPIVHPQQQPLQKNKTQSPSPQTRPKPQAPSRPVNGWSLDFCALSWQSDIFIAKCRLEKMQNKIAKLQKEGKRGEKKNKRPPSLCLLSSKA